MNQEKTLVGTFSVILKFDGSFTALSRTDFEQLQRLLEASLDTQDKQCLADLREYVIKREDSWILDVKLLNFIGALLEHRSANLLCCILLCLKCHIVLDILRDLVSLHHSTPV